MFNFINWLTDKPKMGNRGLTLSSTLDNFVNYILTEYHRHCEKNGLDKTSCYGLYKFCSSLVGIQLDESDKDIIKEAGVYFYDWDTGLEGIFLEVKYEKLETVVKVSAQINGIVDSKVILVERI